MQSQHTHQFACKISAQLFLKDIPTVRTPNMNLTRRKEDH